MSEQTYAPFDLQGTKLSLLKSGRERGFVTEQELIEVIPVGMITPTEVEVFFFTLDMMNIELRLSAEAQEKGKEAGRLMLIHRLTGRLLDNGTMEDFGDEG